MGGPSAERLVSLASGKGVAGALRQLGARVVEVDVTGTDFAPPADVDLCFNVLHGTFGEDGGVQEILERHGMPYTGEGVEVSRIGFDKLLSKSRFLAAGVPTARYEILAPGARPTLAPPLVVKAPRQGSSVGVVVVKDPAALDAALEEVRRYDSEVLVEEYFSGRELTVGLLGTATLPIIEICPKEGFYDFRNKYPFLSPGGGASHFCPANLTPGEEADVRAAAIASARALGLQVYGRADVLLGADGSTCVLEINTIPGMTESSLLPEAAAAEGISYPDLCARIIDLSLLARRKGGSP